MTNPGALVPVEPSAASRPAAPTRRDFLTGVRPPRPSGQFWLRVHRRAMACRFEITMASEDAAWLAPAREALDEIDRLEETLSVFRSTSLISRMNRLAARTAVEADAETLDLLAAMRRAAPRDRRRLRHHVHTAQPLLGLPLSRGSSAVRRRDRGSAARRRQRGGADRSAQRHDSLRSSGNRAESRRDRQGLRAGSGRARDATERRRPRAAVGGPEQPARDRSTATVDGKSRSSRRAGPRRWPPSACATPRSARAAPATSSSSSTARATDT